MLRFTLNMFTINFLISTTFLAPTLANEKKHYLSRYYAVTPAEKTDGGRGYRGYNIYQQLRA